MNSVLIMLGFFLCFWGGWLIGDGEYFLGVLAVCAGYSVYLTGMSEND